MAMRYRELGIVARKCASTSTGFMYILPTCIEWMFMTCRKIFILRSIQNWYVNNRIK